MPKRSLQHFVFTPVVSFDESVDAMGLNLHIHEY